MDTEASPLTPFGPDLWLVDGDRIRMLGIPFDTRMTVARLPDGGLWLHSPVAPTPDRVAAVQSLGPVRHIVAPNKFHNLFVAPWFEQAPDALRWGEPALIARRPDLGLTPLEGEAPGAWGGAIAQTRFEGSNVLPELVFLHRPSRALIVTDILQSHDPARESAFWRGLKHLNGILAPDCGAPRDWRLTVRDKDAARASVEAILAWDFDRVVLSHGICVPEGGKAVFERAFDWLRR
ncbi:MAG: DUF4336 domain-containing protein [Alphaproteobacteria bacterium]|nr:DUF4336 domain-containing protein [Alphaproteobacteria bacterium]